MKFIRLGLQIFKTVGGEMIADWSGTAMAITSSNGPHGFEMMTFEVPVHNLPRAFRIYDDLPVTHCTLNFGGGNVWEGRLEDRQLSNTDMRLTALGYWVALNDDRYTAFWSQTGFSEWRDLTLYDRGLTRTEKFNTKIENEIRISLRKNEAYTTSTLGRVGVEIPDDSSQNIIAVSFDLDMTLGTQYIFRLVSVDGSYGGSATVELSVTGTGSNIARSYNFALAGSTKDSLFIQIEPNTSHTYTGETGDAYVAIKNFRMVTSQANRINTTTTTTISAGSQVVTPASMSGIYLGQRLFIDAGSSTSESVVVTAVTASTFTAIFVGSYSGTTTIHAHAIYADQIIKAIVAQISSLNSTQLSSSVALIESPGVDIENAVYEDALPGDVVNSLLGVNATGGQWEAGVWEGRVLHYRERGSQGRTFYTDAVELVVNSTLDTMHNQYYATYRDDKGRTLRTDRDGDSPSQNRYGLVRTAVAHTNSISSSLAEAHRDAGIAVNKAITPTSRIVCKGLFTANGAAVPFWELRYGDVLNVRNLPPNASEEIDKIRRFTVQRQSYKPLEDDLMVAPELDIPSIEVMIASSYIPPTPAVSIPSQIVRDEATLF